MYGPAAKAKILMFDNVDIQMGEIANMLLQVPAVGVRPYLVLQVRRGPELIHDALTQIRAAMKSGVLKKPLKARCPLHPLVPLCRTEPAGMQGYHVTAGSPCDCR